MPQFLILKFKSIVFLGLFFCLLPIISYGAELYLESNQEQYYQGDTFIVNIRVDNQKQCINTVQAFLEFNTALLEVQDVNWANSLISFWLKEPEFSNETGQVIFTGGIPGGYCGDLLGSPVKTNLLASVIFKARIFPLINQPTSTKIELLKDSQVLLNDGYGTLAKLFVKPKIYTILSGLPEENINEWQNIVGNDNIPPEQLEAQVNQEQNIFSGKYFLIFSAIDKGSGIDYFELKEGKVDWQRAVSPYLLEDQRLKSIIKVRVIDNAGNEAVIEIPAQTSNRLIYGLVILLVLALILAVRFRRIVF